MFLVVILVVFAFLRDLRTTLIPSVAVPVSLLGTFGVMYLVGYSIDNLSLMALTIATGFVVDDAIVVLENVTRHLEKGETPFAAAMQGTQEIASTVVTMSVSLVSVFIPLLLMGGIVGRLFREFAVVLSTAIAISLAVSLTTTPMLCATLLKPQGSYRRGRLYHASERVFEAVLGGYLASLRWVLRHPALMLTTTILTVALTVVLSLVIPKNLFPQQDTGRLTGAIIADQNTSAQSMSKLIARFLATVSEDPAVETAIAVSGGQNGGPPNNGRFFVTMKPLNERKLGVDQVITRLRGKLSAIPGATLILQPVVDLRIGGRRSNAQYQYILWGDNLGELSSWSTTMLAKMRTLPGLADVNSDQMNGGLQSDLTIDRQTAERLGISAQDIDQTLYDAFGQRQIATMYLPLNQYHVVMEMEPRLWQDPSGLDYLRVRAADGSLVPLSVFARHRSDTTALQVNHSGQFPSVTISFNLLPGFSLGTAVDEINDAARANGMPASIVPSFAGTAQAFQESLANEWPLILAAIATVYHRPRHALRELHPPHHHHLHPALGGGRRAARAARVQDRPHHHRLHRHHPAHRHRQEERHPDDRFRARCPAPREPPGGGGDLRGLPSPLPSDHDDHHVGALRRHAARLRHGHRRGTAPAARHRHRRRADLQPGADALHHPGDLPLPGPPARPCRLRPST